MGDARRGVELLITEDESEAKRLAHVLEEENRKRREIDDRTFDEALTIIDQEIDFDRTLTIVLASPDWHPGVIGIVASRIIEKFYRPTILISFDGAVRVVAHYRHAGTTTEHSRSPVVTVLRFTWHSASQ